jgi:(E)-4-hydroxy-3-methyl-but-2-enyl pyrophosphate reductase
VNFLKANDIYPVEINDLSDLKKDDIIIIRSHGISPQTLKILKDTELIIIDLTCPFVSNIQKKVKSYYDSGYSIIIVGDKDHPEVTGINGWCDNTAVITRDGSELVKLPRKVCVVSQTTERQETWEKILNIIVKKCREIVAFNTICSATESRQKCAGDLSKNVDLMIVIGGKNSSNTTKLYEICKNACKNTIHIENSSEIPDNIIKSQNIKNIGITAGASTPDWIIEEVIDKMMEEKDLEMNEQLAYMEENTTQISVGKVIQGEIISINEKEAILNIGYKVEGILPLEEATRKGDVKLTDICKIGDVIKVKVISRKNEEGYVVLSTVELEREKAHDELKSSFENKATIAVTVKEAVKGGLIASFKGIRVFIPASHISLSHIDDLNIFAGKEFDVNIIEYSDGKRNSRIVGSRRDILKAEKELKEVATWENIKNGDIVTGEVKRLTDFGAFIDINGVDGLLHVSQISWGRVNKPSEALKVGDKIQVAVIEADKEARKLSLSIKSLTENPWNNADIKYPVGSIVLGKVARFASFGVFVELEPGVDGLAHISQISHKRVEKPGDVLTIGQQIKAKILDVNKEEKKIGLSIKEANEI